MIKECNKVSNQGLCSWLGLLSCIGGLQVKAIMMAQVPGRVLLASVFRGLGLLRGWGELAVASLGKCTYILPHKARADPSYPRS